MKTPGLFTNFKKVVVAKFNKPINVVLLGDIHFENRNRRGNLCDVKALKRCIDMHKDNPDTYFIGMGDYLDLASTSERKAFKQSDLHETTLDSIDRIAREQVEDLLEILEPLRGRFIGMIEGNHYYEFEDGTTTTHLLCEALDCAYLGVQSLGRVTLKVGTRQVGVDFLLHHGTGGRTLNSIAKMRSWAFANVYAMGHNHQILKEEGTIFKLDNRGQVKEAPQLFIRTGTFNKGVKQDERSYMCDRGSGPSPRKAPFVQLVPRTTSGDGIEVEIHEGTFTL